MNKHHRLAFFTIIITLGLGTALTLALCDGSAKIGSVPTVVWCALVALGINWLAFIPSYINRTEHFFDLTGSVTYVTLIIVALVGSHDIDLRSVLVSAMVGLWALRLGSFLFFRVQETGGDGRFDTIKHQPLTFFYWWSLQALWVFVTGSCALVVITNAKREAFGWVAVIGALLWTGGFLIEVVADHQKTRFRADRKNDDSFIRTGLWRWSRHPNYFGEIVLWVGVTIMAIPLLSGWRWVALISPVFVTVLLTRVSGVPVLEARGRARWGNDEQYQNYLCDTSILLPRKPRGKIKAPLDQH
jgi:steroid 5-alpha reductase family enzyme